MTCIWTAQGQTEYRSRLHIQKNALFCDSAGTCAEQEPQLPDRLSGRLCDRKRPIDLHLMALRHLGAEIEEQEAYLSAYCGKFMGKEIVFPHSSVGATQQAVLAAVCACGETHVYGCAREPEVVWLCRYLETMGAKIQGVGTEHLYIQGVRETGTREISDSPDRIVAGTYLCAAAAARSRITLENVPVGELESFLEVYQENGWTI